MTLTQMIKHLLTNTTNELIEHHDIKGYVDWQEGRRSAFLDVLEFIYEDNGGIL